LSLANAFIALHQDKKKMAEFGKKSREIILKTYAVDQMCERNRSYLFKTTLKYD
jgi:hypothetical protein